MGKTLILGATGNISGMTADIIHRSSPTSLRVATSRERKYERLRARFPDAESVLADWYDLDSLVAAMDGVSKLLVVTPDFRTDEHVVTPNIIKAAEQVGSIELIARILAIPPGYDNGRALRVETVVNSPDDLLRKRRLQHLDELQTKARDVNRRLLDTERVGQGCVLESPAFERVSQSTLTEDGRRAPALRFGDPRVMALLGALCIGLNALGFTNRSLRAQVSHLLGVPTTGYTVNQASYDLARLRLKGLINRRPGTNTYDLTPDGQRVAIFYTKVHDRLLRPLLAADQPPAPPKIRGALTTIDRHVHSRIDNARLPEAA
jgi:hypothetical protein